MDLNAIMVEELAKTLEPELIRAAVRRQLDGLVAKAIESAFSGWKDGPGKALTLKIEEAIGVQVSQVDLTTATLGLTEIVSSEVGQMMQEMALPVVQQCLAGLLKPAPTTVELAEVIEEYRAWAQEQAYMHDDAKAIGLIIQPSDHSKGWVDIYLHPTDRHRSTGYRTDVDPVTWHRCDVQIRLAPATEGGPLRIWALTMRGLDAQPDGKVRALALTEWEAGLYKMFIAGTTFSTSGLSADDYETAFDDVCECE